MGVVWEGRGNGGCVGREEAVRSPTPSYRPRTSVTSGRDARGSRVRSCFARHVISFLSSLFREARSQACVCPVIPSREFRD